VYGHAWRSVAAAFVLLALADLTAVATGHGAWRPFTKPLLMLLLALAFMLAAGGPLDRARTMLIAGLISSAAGDTVLLRSGTAALAAGMVCFAIVHVCYIIAFVSVARGPGLVRRRPVVVLPYVLAWLAAAIVLWPHTGGLAVAVVVYSALVTTMALAALDLIGRIPSRNAVLVAAGAVIFMSSDTTLAFTEFDRALAPPFAPFVVMLTYLVAQTMIAAGMTATTAARPAPGIPVDGRR
jgi:uncharacterized membrane protein YhhN